MPGKLKNKIEPMILQCGKCKTKVNVVIENEAIQKPVFTCPACKTVNKIVLPETETVTPEENNPAGWLLYSAATGETKTYILKAGTNTIGRKTENNTATVLLEVDDKTISRSHITIEIAVNKAGFFEYLVFDNNSANGTYINNEPLKPGNELYLNNEDIIQLGLTKITLKTPYPSATKEEESKTILNNEEQKTIIV
jgi:hypothetical protein